ncbi:hypothetical protein HD554DRAFT_2042801 [Boletus coccyginus]|nr:hypothetical protein HD554DRAFT_2042801 [Boletus coccyginus]
MWKAEEASQEAKGKEAEKMEELPASDSPSKTPESASSVGQKRKRATCKVVLDEEEEEEVKEDDREVQIAGKKLKTKCTKSRGKVMKAVGTKNVVSAAKGKVPEYPLPHVLIPARWAKVSPPHAGPSCCKSPPPVRPALPLFFDSPPPKDHVGEEEEDTLRKKLKTVKVDDSAGVVTAKVVLLSLQTKMH